MWEERVRCLFNKLLFLFREGGEFIVLLNSVGCLLVYFVIYKLGKLFYIFGIYLYVYLIFKRKLFYYIL